MTTFRRADRFFRRDCQPWCPRRVTGFLSLAAADAHDCAQYDTSPHSGLTSRLRSALLMLYAERCDTSGGAESPGMARAREVLDETVERRDPMSTLDALADEIMPPQKTKGA